MKRRTTFLIAILILLSFGSCGDSSSTGTNTAAGPALTAEQSSVTMAVNYIRTVAVTGGIGRSKILSISDSAVVSASIEAPYQVSGKYFQDVKITSKGLGTAKVTVQDSAGTSTVQITVTVAAMVTSPMSVKVLAGRTEYVSIMGGTKPYAVSNGPNIAVADVELTTFSSMYVKGNVPGFTSVTIKDSSIPEKSIVVPIEVVGEPRFTQQGSITFSASAGDFSATGVSAITSVFEQTQLSGEGAGGWVYHSFYSGELITVLGYKMKSLTTVDMVFFTCMMNSLSTGTIPIDSVVDSRPGAYLAFILNRDISSNVFDVYRVIDGTLTFTLLDMQKAAGSFSGKGEVFRDEKIIPGSTFQMNNGVFSIPLIEQGMTPMSAERTDDRMQTILRSFYEQETSRRDSRYRSLARKDQ